MLELMSAKPMDGHHGSRTQVKIPKPSLLFLKYCPWPYFKKKSGKVRKKKLKKVLDPFLSGTTKHMIFALFFPFFAYPFLKLYDFLPRLIAAAIHLKSEDVSTNPAHLLAGSKRPLNAFFSTHFNDTGHWPFALRIWQASSPHWVCSCSCLAALPLKDPPGLVESSHLMTHSCSVTRS